MPGVIYQASTRQVQPFLVFGRLLSIIFFTAILCFGWAVLSYVKNGTMVKKSPLNASPKQNVIGNSDSSAKGSAMGISGTSMPTDKSSRLVYSSSSDKVYFHSIKHLSEQSSRIALSEEAAKARGLKPCPCIIE